MHKEHGECWLGLRAAFLIAQGLRTTCDGITAAFISTLPCWLLVLVLTTTGQAKGPTEAFLMAYFVGDSVAENRMHLCWSLDRLKWNALNNDIMKKNALLLLLCGAITARGVVGWRRIRRSRGGGDRGRYRRTEPPSLSRTGIRSHGLAGCGPRKPQRQKRLACVCVHRPVP